MEGGAARERWMGGEGDGNGRTASPPTRGTRARVVKKEKGKGSNFMD